MTKFNGFWYFDADITSCVVKFCLERAIIFIFFKKNGTLLIDHKKNEANSSQSYVDIICEQFLFN